MSSKLSASQTTEVMELIQALQEEQLRGEDAARLDRWIRDDESARWIYVQYMNLYAGLCWDRTSSDAVVPACQTPEDIVPSPPSVAPVGLLDSLGHGTIGYSSGWAVSYLLATVITGLGLWICSHIYMSPPEQVARPSAPAAIVEPKVELVGRITAMVDCKCADIGVNSRGVPLGRKYELTSGLMEIAYDTGAKVILQGPVTFEVESNGGYLAVGKLTGKLEQRAERREERGEGRKSEITNQKSEITSPQPLAPSPFVIRTPTATVTDLGTEFGVEVDRSGATKSHVFRGSVSLQVVDSGGGEARPVVLRENESARVERDAGAGRPRVVVHYMAADPRIFVRRMVEPPKVLDLLDIVAGGDGRGRRRDRGIDPTRGFEESEFVKDLRGGVYSGYYAYICRLIDGTFVPSGGAKPVQLDSAGHTFDGFPPTSGAVYGSIWPRKAENEPNAGHWLYQIGDRDAKDYMPNHRGLLGLHPNAGITFSLEAMRKSYPGARPARFRAVAGLAKPSDRPNLLGLADIWVFVDGKLKLKRMHLRNQDGAIPIDVALGPSDRFLTIVSTDGGNSTVYDWIVFGDPVLEMTAIPEEGG